MEPIIIPEISPETIIEVVAVVGVPFVVDAVRNIVFQFGMILQESTNAMVKKTGSIIANASASSRFGIAMTALVSFAAAAILARWLGGIEFNVANAVQILGWATLVYKFVGYEKSRFRKWVVSKIDQVGPTSVQKDSDADLLVDTTDPDAIG